MDRRGFLLAGGATLAGLSGCVGVIADDAIDVGMTSNAFVPREDSAVAESAPAWVPRGVPTHRTSVGERVVWENTGSRNHTVTAATPDHGTVEELLGIDHVHGEPAPTDGDGGHDHDEPTTTDGHDHSGHDHDEPTTTAGHDHAGHDHDEPTTTAAHDHADHDHGASAETAASDAPYRLPAAGTFFASGGYDSEIDAVRSFIEEVGGGGAIMPGEQFTHTFETPGWYHYYCIPHLAAGMVATIHVE